MIKLADNIVNAVKLSSAIVKPPVQFTNNSMDLTHPTFAPAYSSVKLPSWTQYMKRPPTQPSAPPQSFMNLEDVDPVLDSINPKYDFNSPRAAGVSPEDWSKAMNSVNAANENKPMFSRPEIKYYGNDAMSARERGWGAETYVGGSAGDWYNFGEVGKGAPFLGAAPAAAPVPPPSIPWYQPRMTTPSSFWSEVNDNLEDLKGAGRDLKNWIWPE